jgi:transcriptional regulator with XRE-family HTH domain
MGILRLKEILKEKGITGKELAEKINISVTGMSNIVKGQSLPREEVLLQIAEILDVDLKELFISTKKKGEPKIELQSIINQLEALKSNIA